MKPDISGRLKQRRQRLISDFIQKNDPGFTRRHARLFDDYFCRVYEKSEIGPRMALSKNPYAIVAMGGYGRNDQCVHSDIDLLFLFQDHVPPEAEALVQEFVYPLWDLGVEVSQTTRSLAECVETAGENYEILVPLLDARFVCGMSPVFSALAGNLKKNVIAPRARGLLAWLVERSRQRHLDFGDSSYLLEPNLKQGQGGLRDYHTILWIAKIDADLKNPRELEYNGYFSQEEYRRLMDAVSYIVKIRNRLHCLAGRKCDQLYFEQQVKLAADLNYKARSGQQPVERFLGELHAHMDFVKEQHLLFLHELGPARIRKRRGRAAARKTIVGGLTAANGLLNFVSPSDIVKRPILLMKIFEESARLKIPPAAEAKRLVKEFAGLANRRFCRLPAVVESFETILVTPAPTFSVLNDMINTGLMQKFIPEMQHIVNRIQYDEYHLYPVDKHSLRVVQTLKRFAIDREGAFNPLCIKLYRALKNKRLLLWAALLHDIGKGTQGGDHSRKGSELARKILASKNLSAEETETVAFLIQEHLMLVKIATRRDINDEETAIFCARQVGDVNRLKMLYLLTVADSMATGPKAWNEWTATLLRDLFLRVLSILEKGELASQAAVAAVAAKKREIIAGAADADEARELEALFNCMSPRYLLDTPSADMRVHIALYRRVGQAEFDWQVAAEPQSNARQVTICAQDRPGLFSKIAGVFTLNGLDILDVKVYTWRNNTALDVFKVKPPPDQIFEEEKWHQARQDLARALAGNLDVGAALKERLAMYRRRRPGRTATRPSRVVVDNDASSFFTIVEVFAYDFPGLLFAITDALFKCRLDVWVAKIATKVDQVVDVFYVRDFDGQKIDSPEHVEAIKKAVAAILPDAEEGGL